MSRPDADFPERWREVGATDLERRLLEATAHEEPSPELRERMALAIGVSTAAIAAATGGAGLGTAATASKAAAGSSRLLLWISSGVVVLAVTGAVVATGTWTGSAPQVSPASPAVIAAAPSPTAPTAPMEVAPAAVAESSPSVIAPAPTHRRPEATTASDLREQIALVDAARSAVAAGAGNRALELLQRYQERYPAGSFRPEAAALKVEALTNLGRHAEASVLAKRFVAEYGKSPLADRVARVAGLARP